MILVGDIDAALSFGKTQIGKPYDHEANTEARFGLDKFDCSGLISRSLWEGGMPRGHAGFGEGSASMASWCEQHPDFRLTIDAAKNTRGAILVKGGTSGIGDLGHVVFSLGDGRTLESNGHRGVCIDDVNRLVWSHGLIAPVNYEHLQGDGDLSAATDQLDRIESLLGNLAKPGALHDINVRLANVESLLGNATKPGILHDMNVELQAIKAKLDA